jgi:flavin-dependent dehydrogenase
MAADRVDFLVLGGGPAGSAFAALAARDGATVLLAERHGYAARRPGEYLDPEILPLLEAIGLPRGGLKEVSAPSPAIVSLWDGAVPIARPFRERGAAPPLAVVRNLFDRLLADQARACGAEAVSIDAAFDLSEAKSGWLVRFRSAGRARTVSARMVIDASGRAAAFARRLGIARDSAGDLYATALWFAPAAADGRAVGPLVIETAGEGWWSLAETGDGKLVAVYYTHKGAVAPPRPRPVRHALSRLAAAPHLNARLARREPRLVGAAAYPAFPSLLRSVGGRNWIAVGDAAAAYDPLCGKGTLFALQSAWRAYQACAGDFGSLLAQYEAAIRFRYERHLVAREAVYRDAGSRLSAAFLEGI